MDQSEGFLVEGKEHMVRKLKKSIYKVNQASKQWYLKFNDIIFPLNLRKTLLTGV